MATGYEDRIIDVRVPKLERFQQQMRKLPKDIRNQMRKEVRGAARPIIKDAKKRYRTRFKRRSGAGARSLRHRVTSNQASILAGGPKAPYIMGQEWGSNGHVSAVRQACAWWAVLVAGVRRGP